MARVSAPKSDKAWQAECDAGTLAEAAAIKADRKRLSAASAAAKNMAAEQAAKAKAMKSIAKLKLGKKKR